MPERLFCYACRYFVHDGYFNACPTAERAMEETLAGLRTRSDVELVPFQPPDVETVRLRAVFGCNMPRLRASPGTTVATAGGARVLRDHGCRFHARLQGRSGGREIPYAVCVQPLGCGVHTAAHCGVTASCASYAPPPHTDAKLHAIARIPRFFMSLISRVRARPVCCADGVGASVDCFPFAASAGRQVHALLGETRIAAIAKRAGARPTHEHWDDVLNLQLYRVSTAGLSGAPPLL